MPDPWMGIGHSLGQGPRNAFLRRMRKGTWPVSHPAQPPSQGNSRIPGIGPGHRGGERPAVLVGATGSGLHSVQTGQLKIRRLSALQLACRGDQHGGETTERQDEQGDHHECQPHFRCVPLVLGDALL